MIIMMLMKLMNLLTSTKRRKSFPMSSRHIHCHHYRRISFEKWHAAGLSSFAAITIRSASRHCQDNPAFQIHLVFSSSSYKLNHQHMMWWMMRHDVMDDKMFSLCILLHTGHEMCDVFILQTLPLLS